MRPLHLHESCRGSVAVRERAIDLRVIVVTLRMYHSYWEFLKELTRFSKPLNYKFSLFLIFIPLKKTFLLELYSTQYYFYFSSEIKF